MSAQQIPGIPAADPAAIGLQPDPHAAAEAGALLRRTRQQRGFGLEECARRLAVPVAVLRRLEDGAPGPLDTGVFLRGHLRSYGALLGIAAGDLDVHVRRLAPDIPPPLVASGRMPRNAYLIERYLRAASFIALTIAFVAPAVWFATHSDSGPGGARLEAIDSAPVPMLRARPVLPRVQGPAVAPPAAAPVQVQQPLLASMTPFIGEPEPMPSTVGTAAGDGNRVDLALGAPSWVEVSTADGQHLEYALLQPGSYHWQSTQPLNVLIGDAEAARVTVDGKPYTLQQISPNNVARFSVGSAAGSD